MIKYLKRITVLVLCLMFCCSCFIVNAAETEEQTIYTYGYFHYIVKDNKVTIAYYSKDNYRDPDDDFSELVIPGKINGMKVVAADPEAFIDAERYNKQQITSVVCSPYMTTVDMTWFNGMSHLQNVTLGKCTKKFLQQGFNSGNLQRISSISVPKDALYMKVVNGALYSKDGTILWAFPAGKVQKSFRVSSNTTTIAKYAFFASQVNIITLPPNLTTIQKNAFRYAFRGDNYKSKAVKVPAGKLASYKTMMKNSGVPFDLYKIKIAEY